jgi:hypothetical protein
MLVIVGFIVVMAAVMGGYIAAGGVPSWSGSPRNMLSSPGPLLVPLLLQARLFHSTRHKGSKKVFWASP